MTMAGPAGTARERGMILVNVLLFVAIASGVVMLMISAEDDALQRATRLAEASRAQAAVRGGELSAIVALRRDAAVARATDNPTEAWASVAESGAPIAGGRFDLAVADAQGRFNVNAVVTGEAAPVEMLGRIAAAAGITPEQTVRAIELLRLAGPIADLRPLRMAGLEPATLARLSRMITALPYATTVNANSADESLLAIMIGDARAADLLVARRRRAGLLTAEDFATAGVTVPPMMGFTSNVYWVRVRVTIGATRRQLTSLLVRRRPDGQPPTVAAVARWHGAAGPAEAPALP